MIITIISKRFFEKNRKFFFPKCERLHDISTKSSNSKYHKNYPKISCFFLSNVVFQKSNVYHMDLLLLGTHYAYYAMSAEIFRRFFIQEHFEKKMFSLRNIYFYHTAGYEKEFSSHSYRRVALDLKMFSFIFRSEYFFRYYFQVFLIEKRNTRHNMKILHEFKY